MSMAAERRRCLRQRWERRSSSDGLVNRCHDRNDEAELSFFFHILYCSMGLAIINQLNTSMASSKLTEMTKQYTPAVCRQIRLLWFF